MMKDYLLGYTTVDFSFNTDISVRTPESGFLLQLGQTGTDFHPVISFSGISGYVFDQRGDFVGGYVKNETFSISGNYDYLAPDTDATGRLSYYLNDTLITNNIYGTGFIDTIRFEGYTDETIGNIAITLDTGDVMALMDVSGVYLQGSGGEYLLAQS